MAMDSVVSGECARAILFCGTGIGMAVVANKYKGIRATPCWNPFTARVSRSHNDSNCLTLGGRILSSEEAVEIVRTWLETPFEGGRHQRRVAKILEVERKNFKP
jgi:ribose 5-phosphate isomerase B